MPSGQLKDIPRFVIGTFAMGISLLLIFHGKPSSLNVIAGLYLLIICAIDTMHSRIPNLCNLALLLAGLIYNYYHFGFHGLGNAFLGFALGLSLFLIPYLMGGIGGGDVKALAALGALLGPGQVFQVFLYTCLIGGVLAIFHYLFQKNLWQKITRFAHSLLAFATTRDSRSVLPDATEKLRFPYAAAFALGFFFYTKYGDVFSLFRL